MQTVDLIASGYDWTCPDCDATMRNVQHAEKVECAKCHKEFEVSSELVHPTG